MWRRRLPGRDARVQVRQLPGALEPGPQRGPQVGQDRWPVGVAGRAASAASAGRVTAVQVRLLPGALEPGLQRQPQVGQDAPVGVAGRGGRDRLG